MAASPTASVAAAASEVNDGPVLCVVSKRLRALRKKQNRIVQMEEAVAAGKTLNREQEEVLRSKPVVAALIDELERLRALLSSALAEELSAHPATPPPASSPSESDSSIQDLLALVYFGSLFDVKPQSEFVTTMVSRSHERSCCITYDYVGDDAADLLMEKDLDAVAALAALAAARPAGAADISHLDALQSCVHHARQWLGRAHEPIQPESPVTYAAVRSKLDRIMASDYYTAQAKITAPMDLAPASGSYGVEGVQAHDRVDVSQEALVFDENLTVGGQKDGLEDEKSTQINTDHQSNAVDSQNVDDESPVNPPEELSSAEVQQEQFGDLEEQDHRNADPEDEQFINPRPSHKNQRGGGRGVDRRGYSNVRGGRGDRGYQNGRGGGGGYGGYQGGGGGYQSSRGGGGGGSGYYNNDSGYYQQRNVNSRGRGGRSGGNSFYNIHGGGKQGGAGHPGRVELGAKA